VARLLGRAVDLDLALDVLRNYSPDEQRAIGMEEIVCFACSEFELTRQQLGSKCRRRRVVTARNLAFYLARKHTELSLAQIGSHFNRRHSTVLKGIANVEREIGGETPLGRQLASTAKRIQGS